MTETTQTTPARMLCLVDEQDTFDVTESDLGLVGGSATPGVIYTLRPLTKAAIAALRKQHTGGKAFSKETRTFETPFDQEGFDAALLDAALVGWQGVGLRDRETGAYRPAPCTKAHKLRLDALRQQLIVTKAQANRAVDLPATEEDAAADSFRDA
jgi:hypothetical protein